MSNPILQAVGLSKVFSEAGKTVHVFKDLDFELTQGETVAIIGRSGAGKSTLLHILGGLDDASSGEVAINGKNWNKFNENQRSKLRNESLGFIYQFHHLLPEFTALENVAMPLLLQGIAIDEATNRAHYLLTRVGLASRVEHKLAELSGGERQRVAIVRAMVNNPSCILADEPTGNLDNQTADLVFNLLIELNQELKTSLVLVTHDRQLAQRLDKVYQLEQGKLVLVN